MLIRLSLLLILSTCLCPAAFRASTNVFVSIEVDTDEDGLDDEMELLLGTNPDDADTDGDDWDDLTETIQGADPCNPHDSPKGFTTNDSDALPSNPTLRLKVQELLAARRQRAVISSPVAHQEIATFSLRYFYQGENLPDLAAEVIRSDLKAGSFLLIWRHHVRWNPLEIEQRYTVSVRTDDGRTLAEWKTPVPVDTEWRYVGLPFSLQPADEGRLLTLSLIPEGDGKLEYSLADFIAKPAGLEADVDRDGAIGGNERPANGKPIRHWINDDDDQGEYQKRSDVPGRPSSQADFAHAAIDGMSDLVDFLPINLNLSHLTGLLRPSDGFRYYVTHSERAIQVALTSLSPSKVGLIHRDINLKVFGPRLNGEVTSVEILEPDTDGRIEIPSSFIDRITAFGHGVILMEGAKASRKPLQLEIRKSDKTVATIEQPMAIVPVETMYRHVNLTRVTCDYSGRPAAVKKVARPQQIGEPTGLPDIETNGRWAVLIHGYNVPADGARGWHAETFKRLHVLGSRARFVGVTWNGDTGLDYHKAVYHAFQTGDEVPKALGFLDASRTLLIGHSLGNIVASQAVQAGFTPAHYFLLNAALPIEALAGRDNAQQQTVEMTEEYWRPYGRKLYATDWAKLFAPGDFRRTITWEDCFSRVRSLGIATNFYSLGEDVTNSPSSMVSASVLATLWSGRAIDYGAWKTQELLKGVGWSRSIAAVAMERTQGGWGFNPAWRGRYVPSGPTKSTGGYYERMDPITAGRIMSAQLTQDPFFRPLYEGCLRGPRLLAPSPILDCSNMRYDLLARAIPAITFAAGAAPVPPTDDGSQVENFDLETLGRTDPKQWPNEGHGATRLAGRWLHSDFKNVALPYVTPFYAQMIKSAALR
jgi:hypothetical protein